MNLCFNCVAVQSETVFIKEVAVTVTFVFSFCSLVLPCLHVSWALLSVSLCLCGVGVAQLPCLARLLITCWLHTPVIHQGHRHAVNLPSLFGHHADCFFSYCHSRHLVTPCVRSFPRPSLTAQKKFRLIQSCSSQTSHVLLEVCDGVFICRDPAHCLYFLNVSLFCCGRVSGFWAAGV